jgi:chromosome segregation ATPase
MSSAALAARALLAKIDDAMPEIEEFHNWKGQKAARLAELAAVKAEAERHRNIGKDHQAAVDELRAEREKLRQEITGLHNDRARLRRQADELATWLKITKFQHRVE